MRSGPTNSTHTRTAEPEPTQKPLWVTTATTVAPRATT